MVPPRQSLTSLAIRTLLLIAAVVIAYWIFAALSYGQKDLIPPDIPLASNFHCAVEPSPDSWKATATVTYVNPTRHRNPPWDTTGMLIAEYKGKNRKKMRGQAAKACLDWLDAVDKVRAAVMPVDAKKEVMPP